MNLIKSNVENELVNVAFSAVGNFMEELTDTELDMLQGACAWYNISCHLGNDGAACTLTVECQRSCR